MNEILFIISIIISCLRLVNCNENQKPNQNLIYDEKLNNLDQNNEELIKYIREKVLIPPAEFEDFHPTNIHGFGSLR